jgi:hypothetical protein
MSNQEPCSQHYVIENQVAILVTRFDLAEKSRAEFRSEMRERAEKQEKLLEAISVETRKTNGRVTRLEDTDIQRRIDALEAAEIATRIEFARARTGLWIIGCILGVLQTLAFTVLNFWLK